MLNTNPSVFIAANEVQILIPCPSWWPVNNLGVTFSGVGKFLGTRGVELQWPLLTESEN
jgi:hypothetical protein